MVFLWTKKEIEKYINCSFKELISKYKATEGNNISISRVKEIIVETMQEQWKDANKPLSQFKAPGASTLRRYAAKIIADPTINLARSVANKTETRFAAERSLRCTIAYMMTVANAHYFEGEPIKDLHKNDDDEMSIGSKIMKKLVEGKNPGKKIIHVLPGMVFTTDAITCFATVGLVRKENELYLSFSNLSEAKQSGPTSSNRANCTTERHGDRHKRGLRIELHVTFNMLGHVAGLFCVIYGLSKEEMPGHGTSDDGNKDIISMPIAGLVTGSHMLQSCTAEGMAVFVRGKVDKEGNIQEQEGQNEEESVS